MAVEKHEFYGFPAAEDFSFGLYQLIKQKNVNLICLANAELIALCWQLSKLLNQAIDGGSREQESIIAGISPQLSTYYGSFFSVNNLSAIAQFARKFSDFNVISQFKLYLSWQHLLLLLALENKKERDFYFALKVEQGLSVDELQNAITIDLYKRQADAKPNYSRDIFPSDEAGQKKNKLKHHAGSYFKQILEKKDVITNPFAQPFAASFRALTDPSLKNFRSPNSQASDTGDADQGLINTITEEVIAYRTRQNRQLNLNMNLLFWEIGRQIKQQLISKENENVTRGKHIQTLSTALRNRFGLKFSAGALEKMVRFYELFTDLTTATLAAYLLPWRFIRALLKLPSAEVAAYYVNKLASRPMSWPTLQKQMNAKEYESNKEKPVTKSPPADNSFSNNLTTKSVVKKKNPSVTITYSDIHIVDMDARLIQPDVFSDPFILKFIELF